MKGLSDNQRHALHMLTTRFDGGVFNWFSGRAFAAANTLASLERRGLIALVSAPALYAVTKSGRTEAREFQAKQPAFRVGRSKNPKKIQLMLPLGG